MTAGLGDHPRVPDRIPAAPDVAVSRERLEERAHLGSGETAEVVEMRVAGTDAVVAVKQPRLESTLQTETVERFVAEAEKWSKLDDHDHVVDVVDWGETPVPWIALEYMDGGPLTDRVGDRSTEEALWIGICAADGVWGAHRRGVAHLDLKPDNVLFRTTPGDRWDVPKVSDWGLARLLLDEAGDVDGLSPRYASPEQLDPDRYGAPDDRSDVYQLGTIVYELLTGEPVFAGPATTVVDRHLDASPTPPTEVAPSLPAAADEVVLDALAKAKERRYESMLDFRRALAALFETVTGVSAADPSAVAGPGGTGGGAPRSDGRLDPLDAGENDRRDGDTPGDLLGEGSSIDAGSDGTRILDRIREQTEADHEQRVPWQEREDHPGLDEPDDDSAPDEPVDDDRPTEPIDDAPPDEPSPSTSGAELLAGVGLVLGLLVGAGALVGGSIPGVLAGGAVAAGSLWVLGDGV